MMHYRQRIKAVREVLKGFKKGIDKNLFLCYTQYNETERRTTRKNKGYSIIVKDGKAVPRKPESEWRRMLFYF